MDDAPSPSRPLGLFDAFGVELEYMIVDAATLDVRPIADELFRAATGEITGEFETPDITWSNELALHVIELKTTAPAQSLVGLADKFQTHVGRINNLLRPLGARLMPTAMHPWMDPVSEMRLWPHDYSPVYEAFHRVFDCRGHGWANLQSVHLNLPFAGDAKPDDEFGRLHAAIRLLLPLLPALAASSPVVEGRVTGLLDNRLDVYRKNARNVPSIGGQVIPEPVFTRGDYEEQILKRIYTDIAPYDPEGILQHEWLNARGAIARFDRGAIEIRVLDIQEHPAADMAIVMTIVETLRALVAERFTSLAEQQAFATDPLHAILLDTIRAADGAVVRDRTFLRQFGLASSNDTTAGDVWRGVAAALEIPGRLPPVAGRALNAILTNGPLARRIVAQLESRLPECSQRRIYHALAECLHEGSAFQ